MSSLVAGDVTNDIKKYYLEQYQRGTPANNALWIAASRGDVAGCAAALAAGGCVNWFNDGEGGTTPLHAAARSGDAATAALKLLVAHESEDEAMRAALSCGSCVLKQTVLHYACAAGSAQSVRLLLAHGLDKEQPDSYGRTPLLLAAADNRVEILRLLLAEGASASARSSKEETALHMAVASAMSKTRARGGDGADAETLLVVVEQLLLAGADADAADANGSTALHLLAQARESETSLQLAKLLLLKHKANCKLRDASGKRPSDILSLRTGKNPCALLKLLKDCEMFVLSSG